MDTLTMLFVSCGIFVLFVIFGALLLIVFKLSDIAAEIKKLRESTETTAEKENAEDVSKTVEAEVKDVETVEVNETAENGDGPETVEVESEEN